MSVLVKWDSDDNLLKGWIPVGLTSDDFDTSPDTETIPNSFIAYYNGDIEGIAIYGLTAYEYPEPKVYSPANQQVMFNDTPAQGLGNTFYGVQGVPMTLSADIRDDQGQLQVWIDQNSLGYPPVLKMPIVKMVGGSQGVAVDEVYLNTTLIDGVLTATGVLPSSGDWKLTSERLNQSLKAINADWSIKDLELNILV